MILALLPLAFGANVTERLTTLFIYLILAAMWNALAGYAGLISVGQQMFFGLAAYATIRLSYSGVPVYFAILIGAALSGLTAFPLSVFMLRLRAGDFRFRGLARAGRSQVPNAGANSHRKSVATFFGICSGRPAIVGEITAGCSLRSAVRSRPPASRPLAAPKRPDCC